MLILFEKIDGNRDSAISEAFTVATAARELGDLDIATTALRVIDDHLQHRTPSPADVAVVTNYFR
jgi:hypothetical protein